MNARVINGTSRLYVGYRHQEISDSVYHRMASSKSLADHKSVRYFLLPLVGLLICSVFVTIANGNIKHRCCLENLRIEKAYLQTRVGLLEQQWHRETSRDVITRRATVELKLHTSAAPATIVVLNQSNGDNMDLAVR